MAALFIVPKGETAHRCIDRWLNKWWPLPTKQYVALKRKETLTHTATWINLRYYAKLNKPGTR